MIIYGVTFDIVRRSYTAKVLCNQWIVWIGNISYAMFLVQAPVIGYYQYVAQYDPKPG